MVVDDKCLSKISHLVSIGSLSQGIGGGGGGVYKIRNKIVWKFLKSCEASLKSKTNYI